MPRLPVLALLGAAALASPAQAQFFWPFAEPDCPPVGPAWAYKPPAWAYQPALPPPSPWEPRHDPWLTPQWHRAPAPPSPLVTRREWLSQQDPRAWHGEPRQAWHAEDDRRHGRWRGTGLFD